MRLAIQAVILASASGVLVAHGRDEQLPNILVVVADDLGWSDVTPEVPTPNVERLMEAGVTYSRAYSMPLCLPTRHTLFFGRYGRRDGIDAITGTGFLFERNLPRRHTRHASVAKSLKARGYSTALFGKWQLASGPHLGTRQHVSPEQAPASVGFDTWRAGTVRGLDGYFEWDRIDDGVRTRTTEYATTAVTNAALDWWDATPGPKLAWVSHFPAHSPYHAPPAEALPPGWPPPVGKRQEFEAMIATLDWSLGKLLERIDLAETLVVFISDNGTPWRVYPENSGSSGSGGGSAERRSKGTTFEDGVRVPLVVAGPGVATGRECRGLVSTVDLFATLADYVDAPLSLNAAIDGVSFAPSFSDPADFAGRDWVFFEWYDRFADDRAVRTRTHKLRVVNGVEELYDLVADPLERDPLDPAAPELRGVVDGLRKILAEEIPPRL